jgi:hypothetical protein
MSSLKYKQFAAVFDVLREYLSFYFSIVIVPLILVTLGIIELLGPISHIFEFALPIRLTISGLLLGTAIVMTVHEKNQERRIEAYNGLVATLGTIIPVMNAAPHEGEINKVDVVLQSVIYALSHFEKKDFQMFGAAFLRDEATDTLRLIGSYPQHSPQMATLKNATHDIVSHLRQESGGGLYLPRANKHMGLIYRRTDRGRFLRIVIIKELLMLPGAIGVKSLYWTTEDAVKLILVFAANREGYMDRQIMLVSDLVTALISSTLK